MNKFIGISLGLLLYGKVNRDNENKIRDEMKADLKNNNSRNFIKRQFEDFIPDYQLVNITNLNLLSRQYYLAQILENFLCLQMLLQYDLFFF